MALVLFLVIIAIVLGIIGAVANGLGYLLVIGVLLFAADLVYVGVRWSRRAWRRPVR
ncbi:hypothetical protein ABIA33_002767 [Streptacidiphilus sp. MAP12-16]|jgi:hypothetical protein|uniref:hypothetical protein n=1 Tax=Streptacidiphilus sp. MAP12-16 TaxID=3156300 RepID=UPI003513F277